MNRHISILSIQNVLLVGNLHW